MILRNINPQCPSLPPLGNVFYESELIDGSVDVLDSNGKKIASRPHREVVRRSLTPADLVKHDDADDYSVKSMLLTGMNADPVTKPYFKNSESDFSTNLQYLDAELRNIPVDSAPFEPAPADSTPVVEPSKTE